MRFLHYTYSYEGEGEEETSAQFGRGGYPAKSHQEKRKALLEQMQIAVEKLHEHHQFNDKLKALNPPGPGEYPQIIHATHETHETHATPQHTQQTHNT